MYQVLFYQKEKLLRASLIVFLDYSSALDYGLKAMVSNRSLRLSKRYSHFKIQELFVGDVLSL